MRDILKGYKIFHLDPAQMRSKNFYKNLLEMQMHLMAKYRHVIKQPHQFVCPLCQKSRGSVFLEYRGYPLFECSACSLVSPNIDFNKIREDEIYDSAAYERDVKREILDTYEYRKKTLAPERVHYILEKTGLTAARLKLLDVGCGPGYFLSYLTDQGIANKGIELTPYLVDICRQKGLTVTRTDVGDEPNEEYNVITLFDVLEHVSNPLPFFRTLSEKLGDGGYVLAYTPHIHSLAYALMGGKQNTLAPYQHVCFYNERSLQYLAAHTNFRVHSIDYYGLDIMDYFCYKLTEDKVNYLEKLKEFIPVMQAIVDKQGLSNHMRVLFKKI